MSDTRKGPGLIPTPKEVMIRTVAESPTVGRDLFNFICGDYLGHGISRAVFVYARDPKWVVKIDGGIDRKDCKKGYTQENSLPCCQKCNTMKFTYDVDSFLKHINKIFNHQNRNNYD